MARLANEQFGRTGTAFWTLGNRWKFLNNSVVGETGISGSQARFGNHRLKLTWLSSEVRLGHYAGAKQFRSAGANGIIALYHQISFLRAIINLASVDGSLCQLQIRQDRALKFCGSACRIGTPVMRAGCARGRATAG
jgi:hypothetical protein